MPYKDLVKRLEYRKTYYQEHKAEESLRHNIFIRALRSQVFQLLGNKCANPDCRYLNLDGTLGCKDLRVLQIDHIYGGGTQEVKQIGMWAMLKKILDLKGSGYQLLCPTCNWLKRELNQEI